MPVTSKAEFFKEIFINHCDSPRSSRPPPPTRRRCWRATRRTPAPGRGRKPPHQWDISTRLPRAESCPDRLLFLLQTTWRPWGTGTPSGGLWPGISRPGSPWRASSGGRGTSGSTRQSQQGGRRGTTAAPPLWSSTPTNRRRRPLGEFREWAKCRLFTELTIWTLLKTTGLTQLKRIRSRGRSPSWFPRFTE